MIVVPQRAGKCDGIEGARLPIAADNAVAKVGTNLAYGCPHHGGIDVGAGDHTTVRQVTESLNALH